MSGRTYNPQLNLESIVTITVTQVLCSEKYLNIIANRLTNKILGQLEERLKHRNALLENRIKCVEERLDRYHGLVKRKNISFHEKPKNKTMDSQRRDYELNPCVNVNVQKDNVRNYCSVEMPYTIVNERNGRKYDGGGHQKSNSYQNGHHSSPRAPSALSRGSGYDTNGSDIYVTSGAYKAPSEFSRSSRARAPSHYSYRSGVAPSVASTAKSRTSRKAGMSVEAMAAPNPFCPNIKGMCCLMLLLNLGIILVTLGFVIVIQFFEPIYVWVLGIVFLIFGFLTLIGSLIYCVIICKDVKRPSDVNPEDLYWTHHWQKNIGSSEIHYKAGEKYADDRYSDRYSVSKLSGKYSDRNGRY